MHVVGHEHVRVDRTFAPTARLEKRLTIPAEVVRAAKGGSAIMATLNDVDGMSGDNEAGLPGHRETRWCGSNESVPDRPAFHHHFLALGVRTIVLTPLARRSLPGSEQLF